MWGGCLDRQSELEVFRQVLPLAFGQARLAECDHCTGEENRTVEDDVATPQMKK